MPDMLVRGLPGVKATRSADHRIVFRQGDWLSDLAGGKVIDGSKSRDPGNTGDLDCLRAGTLMGMITSSKKYAPAVIGTLASAALAGATSLTISAAQAVELVRRIGATGTFKLTGPASAGLSVAQETVTYSGVDTTTGVVTVTAITNAYVAGSFVGPTDGSQIPLTLIPDGFPIKVTDDDGTSIDVPFAQFPIAGVITGSQLLPYPTDVALRAWIESFLSAPGGGKFVFDWNYK